MLALGAAVNWQAISNRTAKLSSLCTELKNFSQNADAYRKAELRSQELQEFRMGRAPFRTVGDHSGEESW